MLEARNMGSTSASVSRITLFRSISACSLPLTRENFSRLLTISEARNEALMIFSSTGWCDSSSGACFISI